MLNIKIAGGTGMKVIVWSLVVALHGIAFGSLFIVQGCGTRGDTPPLTTPPMPPRVYVHPEPQEKLPPPEIITQPLPEEDAKIYTVRRGDSLSVIAQRYDISLGEIMELNNIKNKDVIVVGQELKLPARVDLSAAEEPQTARQATVTPSGDTYVVQSGDSLSKIAVEFGTTVGKLREHNNLASDLIKVGQKLKIPGAGSATTAKPVEITPPREPEPEPEPVQEQVIFEEQVEYTVEDNEEPVIETTPIPDSGIIHVVQSDEDLESIARLYDVTVDNLAALNDIEADASVSPGTRLRIP